MPDSRPMSSLRYEAYDDPPAADASNPRTRLDRLQRALQNTNELAPEVVNMAEVERPGRPSGPVNTRRRQRSPSSERDTPNYRQARRTPRHKAPRLYFDHTPDPRPCINYGHFGQVQPGRLRLELVSCDGGEHTDARHPQTFLGAKNVLRHDKSVYCSTRPTSNMVLRHTDDTPFCLEKLHIVGPENGFTAPVREGLVYVAMAMCDLQKYVSPPPYAQRTPTTSTTATTNPPQSRPPRLDGRRRTIHLSPEPITLLDALRDPDINAALDPYNPGDQRHQPHDRQLDESSDEFYTHTGFPRPDDTPCDLPPGSSDDTEPWPSWPSVGNNVPVTLLSDEETGPEDVTSSDVLDFRQHRRRLMQRRHEIENWDQADRYLGPLVDPDEHTGENGLNLNRLDALMARSRVHDSPHHNHPNATGPNSESIGSKPLFAATTKLSEEEAYKDPNVTCARFQIKRGKHKVAIKFEPAISGRFLLLKLSAGNRNVDVQSIIAKGYGGGRYFPAVQLV